MRVYLDNAGCDYLLTTDDRLKYSSDRIKIVDPIEFIRRIEGTDDE